VGIELDAPSEAACCVGALPGCGAGAAGVRELADTGASADPDAAPDGAAVPEPSRSSEDCSRGFFFGGLPRGLFGLDSPSDASLPL